ncbi:aromatic/alkene monooxygenase hydroxylase subunit beta [Zavarzinia sp.]|uniref:aromatic/alkene monooxygenase hydroxylase subunit beta n=1 Tax=Zavarzinia sp. TaxID=2027920 RepID=UPI0035631039
MSLEIKTASIQPRRHTFANVARRLGADKPASRYDEAMYDLQATEVFHYRPTWEPQYELFDSRRTAIVMADWHALRDPRQYYYGTYTIARSRMMEAAEKAFSFAEKRSTLSGLTPAWAARVQHYLLPLRHYEWGANMNNSLITDIGFCTAITQATMYATMDRLGIAQLISRIGLLLDDSTGSSLATAKELWLHDAAWQGLRQTVEDTLVMGDWFELFVAQNLALDGVIYPLVYRHFDAAGQAQGGAALSPLTEFMSDWFDETSRWVDAVITVAAKESEANRALLSAWTKTWKARAAEAVRPIATQVLGDGATEALDLVLDDLDKRARKLTLEI